MLLFYVFYGLLKHHNWRFCRDRGSQHWLFHCFNSS